MINPNGGDDMVIVGNVWMVALFLLPYLAVIFFAER
jgi:hypothetical protein